MNPIISILTLGVPVVGNTGGAALPPNLLVNPEWVGAISGSPGTAPESWLYSTAGTVDVVVSGGQLTFSATSGRCIMYQAILLEIGVYDLEATADGDGTAVSELVFTSDFDAYVMLIDGVEVAFGAAVTGVHQITARITMSTSRSIQARYGIGLQSSVTGSAVLSGPTMRKIA